MQKSKYFFSIVCLLMAAALLFTGCAHPWRLANNPYTPAPTGDVKINGSQEPTTDDITSDPGSIDTAEPSGDPVGEATDEPDDETTDEPDETATGEPDTEAPTGGNANTAKPTDKPNVTSTPKPTTKPTPKPTPAPEADIKPFSTKAINNSNTYDNSMFGKAKVTMINIWSTTCGPCIQELPHIQQLSNAYSSRGVKIVTALGDSEQSGAIQTALNIIGGISGFNLPVLRCNASFNAQFPAGAYPTTYFIDQNGNILKVVTTSNSYDGWCKILDGLLK